MLLFCCPSRRAVFLAVGLAVFSARIVHSAALDDPNGRSDQQRWVSAKFDAVSKPVVQQAFLNVLANHDPVQLNSRNGRPMRLGDKPYSHGLYCHAVSKIVVRLPSPGHTFTATVGVDWNENTSGGAGSVVFSVTANGKKAFDSGLMRPGTAALPVNVDLAHASEFTLEVGDGGDGYSADQADWADAQVVLDNGQTLWLADLPFAFDKTIDTAPFFSFLYDGKPSAELLPTWQIKRSSEKLFEGCTTHTLSYSDPKTGLEIRCEGVAFNDFPAVEWTLRFKNSGPADTPILENILALDSPLPGLASATLHWSKGGVATFDDFAPQSKTFEKPGDTLHLQPGGGRSSNAVLPFFNASGSGFGTVMAIGWSGEWAGDFTSTSNGLALKAGLAKTHLVLHPGESIRTPKILLLFYGGDRWQGQNQLRRFILAHHRPAVDGKPMGTPITWGVFGSTPAEVHQYNIGKIIDHNLPLDYYWVDAGWYGTKDDWYAEAGDWELARNLYPNGFKPIGEQLEKAGRHLMVWFEPERVHNGTAWSKLQPGWLLTREGAGDALVNLGNPDALKFVTDEINAKIDAFGLGTGCYRQDYNIDPLVFWEANDATNRQGISESHYIEGLYAYWDGLRAKHPSMIIDNCASGGRRIDLETTSRATPFWRTDGPRDAVAHQCHSYGLMAWVPLSAISEDREGDDYEFRSSMCSSLCINWQHSGDGAWWKLPDNFPFDWAKKTLDQYLALRHHFLADYYPLTPYTQDQGAWMAWQFYSPETGEGMVQAFRREQSAYTAISLKLRGLNPDAVYALKNADTGAVTAQTGRALMDVGLPLAIDKQPGAAIILLSLATQAPIVINKGRCGQNSGIAREAFAADALNLSPKPDFALIYIGMNDVINDKFFTPLDPYIANVAWMIEQSRKAGIKPVVCTIHHCVEAEVYKHHAREKFGTETVNAKMDRYNAALKKLAADQKIELADFGAVADRTPQSEFLSADGVHLTPAGNRLLAQTFYAAIAPQLRGSATIVCCGDSLTYGYQNAGAGSADGETYPAQLRLIAAAHP